MSNTFSSPSRPSASQPIDSYSFSSHCSRASLAAFGSVLVVVVLPLSTPVSHFSGTLFLRDSTSSQRRVYLTHVFGFRGCERHTHTLK